MGRIWAVVFLIALGLMFILTSQLSLSTRHGILASSLPPALQQGTTTPHPSDSPRNPPDPSVQLTMPGAERSMATAGSPRTLPSLCQANAPLAQYIMEYIDAKKEGLLVWSCPPDRRCGGYGDRMKGITSAFLIALLTHRQFGIFHTDPVELRQLLQPTPHIPWDNYPKMPRPYSVQIKDRPPRLGKDVISKLSSTVWLETNQDLVEYLRSLPAFAPTLQRMGLREGCTDLSCVYGCLFNTLFDVGELLQSNVTAALRDHPRYVSVQVRTGGGEVSGWSDPMRTSHYVVDRMWDVVDDWKRQHCIDCDIFLTTDSASQQKAAQQRYGKALFFVDGAITHSDRSSQQKAALGFPKVVMDNLMIGLAVHGVISNSGFSYTAVWRTKLNSTVVRMNKERTGYYIEPHVFQNPLASWAVVTVPLIPLPAR